MRIYGSDGRENTYSIQCELLPSFNSFLKLIQLNPFSISLNTNEYKLVHLSLPKNETAACSTYMAAKGKEEDISEDTATHHF